MLTTSEQNYFLPQPFNSLTLQLEQSLGETIVEGIIIEAVEV